MILECSAAIPFHVFAEIRLLKDGGQLECACLLFIVDRDTHLRLACWSVA
jgi:hypothetical protein